MKMNTMRTTRRGENQTRTVVTCATHALLLIAGCGTSMLAQMAHAQADATIIGNNAPPRSVYLYGSGDEKSVKIGAWGNGVATKAQRVQYEGIETLSATTRNFNEGIRFDLNTPLPIAPYLNNGLFRMRVRFGSSRRSGRGGYGGGGYGGGGYGGGGVDPRGGDGEGGGGYGGGGYGGGGVDPREGGGGGYGGGEGEGGPGGGGYNERLLQSPALGEARVSQTTPMWRGAAQYGGPRSGGGYGGGGSDPREGGGYGGGGVDPREGGGYGGGGVDPREGGGYGGGGYGGGGVDPRGGGGGYGGGGYGGFGRTASTSITRFQVTFMLERGAMVGGIDFTNRDPRPDQSGWQLLSLPIKEMRSTPGASGAVRRVIVTSDQEDTWYLAQASLVGETSDIKVSIRQDSDAPGAQIGEITVRPGPLTLVADVEAGATDTMIEWNFDADNVGNLPIGGAGAFDGMGGFPGGGGGYGGGGVDPRGGGGYGGGGVDPRGGGYGGGGVDPRGGGGYGGGGVDPRGGGRGGGGYGGGGVDPRGGGGGEEGGMGIDLGPRIDARGLQAKFEYPNEEQNYRVEVTVRDRSGKKAPATASILVKVRG